MSRTDFNTLLEAGAHFGHLKRKWNPKMAPYIFMEKNGIHIIDLHKTVLKLDEAANALKQIAKSGRRVLFVATKKQAKEIVAEKIAAIGMPYVTERWAGGMLTNFPTIRKAVKKMSTIDKMTNDGTFDNFSKREKLQIARQRAKLEKNLGSIADLIAYRLRNESIVERGETAEMPTEYGMFKITVFRQKSNGLEHMVLTKGEWTEDEPVLLRVHSSCATGDILGSCRCDCGAQLHEAMRMIEKEGKGAVVYLSQEGRGIGLFNKIAAYKLQDEGLDTVDANVRLGFGVDERDYGVGASIIREMGIKHMRLMTNNPLKRVGLEGYGLKIDEIVPIVIAPNKYNERYLETKQERMHHKLNLCKH